MTTSEDISARKRTESELLESERRYRHIFHATAVSLREEDFCHVIAATEDLRRQGVTDFRTYIDTHPDFVDRAIPLVRVVDVNR